MDVRKASSLVVSSRSAIKNRKRMDEIGDPCGIPVFISMSSVSPSSTLIVVVLSRKKLLIYRIIIFRILLFFILFRRRACKT